MKGGQNIVVSAAQSISQNIAEGNGKGTELDRRRYFVPSQRRNLPIARGSASECAAIQDILVVCGVIDSNDVGEAMKMLPRIVSILRAQDLTEIVEVPGQ